MMQDERLEIDAAIVRKLVDRQFPHWAELPVCPVETNGWDNSTFRLGKDMKVRLPTAARYAPQVEKEHRWLPFLLDRLPVSIPSPLAVGRPTDVYPFPWSVYRWIEGETAATASIADLPLFATELVRFLTALQQAPTGGGPCAGPHSFFRGGPLAVYDSETATCLAGLRDKIDADGAYAVWKAALAASWNHPDVWVHGDFAAGNLLVDDGRLCGVLDFGNCAIGDPACDLVIAWTFLNSEARSAFRSALPLDEATWARARGWALWKALLTLSDPTQGSMLQGSARNVIMSLVREHQSLDANR